jgi:anti-sigma regulatory factor (Ser/Thr protein kinase)
MNDEILFSQEFLITGGDFPNAGTVATQIKSVLKEIGFDPGIVRRAAIACYEAEMNVVMYADRAVVRLSATPSTVRIQFDDQGRGIPDIQMAMQEGYSTATPQMREMGFGAGMGLPNIKRNSDIFDITSQLGKGTKLDITILTG